MKVLFAVSNENISTQIVKKYQKDYKEIISYKNMYYFNAIVKELQRDKSYDRIVISEDLEPFANNNSDAIDKFLFEKLDNISDEATGINGEDIPIILLSTDRRTKSEPILVKLFGIGIYNALLGQDRSTTNVCNLLNKPRGKKEAKLYYKIESDEVNYKSESEENVSEAEIKNILNHYKRLGKDEDRYIESFNNIAAQYNDAQLRIITKFLPLNVKAVLEERSPKYQSVMTFGDTASTINTMKKQKESEGLKIGFLNNSTNRPNKPVIVPTAVKKVATKKVAASTTPKVKRTEQIEEIERTEQIEETVLPGFDDIEEDALPGFNAVNETVLPGFDDIEDNTLPGFDNIEETTLPGFDDIVEETEQAIEQPVKRGRGRPKKVVAEELVPKENVAKRGRGRPRKVVQENLIDEEKTTLLGFDDEADNTLPGFDDLNERTLPKFDDIEENNTLPGFDDINEKEDILPGFDIPSSMPDFENMKSERDISNNAITNYNEQKTYSANVNLTGLLSKDRKIVSFVGTTKNGTSFLVNNLAKCLSSMGIKTAILDLTTNRNSYYIYTKNEEQLRNIAFESIKKLRSGIANGISVDRYLDVYTALPGDSLPLQDVDGIVSTLLQNYSIVLMDCDFDTPAEYFGVSQEVYIVQTMDILTIQPMTAFLRDLKAKDILKPEKIRVIINKEIKVRGLTPKTIIGGLAFYNDPAMSFMTELFNKDTVKYCTIPFEEDAYSRYLEGVMDCEITISGYSRMFNTKLKELANMVYPLLGNKYKPMGDYSSNNKFSTNMNNTLEQMRNKY